MAELYPIGTLCWAKMKGFPPWPGRVSNPPASLKKSNTSKKGTSMHCIYFFGSNNYAWIEESQIKPYEAFKEQFSKAAKTTLKEAIDAIEDYINNKGEDMFAITDPEAEFNKLKESTVGIEHKDENRKDKKENQTPKKPKDPSVKKRKEENLSHSTSIKKAKKEVEESISNDTSLLNHTPSYRKTTGPGLLQRPSANFMVSSQQLDLESVSQTLKDKNILPSKLKFGFLGLGIMGSGIVKNLLNSGHNVIVWNRTTDKSTKSSSQLVSGGKPPATVQWLCLTRPRIRKLARHENHLGVACVAPHQCDKFVAAGAELGMTPSDVVASADITFSCVADPQAAKDMVFGNCGVLSENLTEKGYIEMTGIDPETSQDIAESITGKGGRYLEAQIQGSRTQAEEGTLIILAAGDRSLFDECQSCFEAMGKNSFYFGEVGNASRMNLVLQMMNGVALAGLAEGLALADRAGLQQKDVMEVLELTQLACPMLVDKGKAIIEGGFPTHLALMHMQKDLRLSLSMGDRLEQPLPLSASANEIFKHAKRLGYSEHDVSAVYIRARF